MTKPSFENRILSLAAEAAATDTAAEAERLREADQATRRAKAEQAEAEALKARLEAEALSYGADINQLLDKNPHFPPPMPRFEARESGLAQPRDHTDPMTGVVSQVRDPLYRYEHVGYLRPLFLADDKGPQVSVGDDNRIYTGVGGPADKYPRRINGKTKSPEPGAEGAYDLAVMPAEKVVALMKRESTELALARLVNQTTGFSNKIDEQRALERHYAQLAQDQAAAEKAKDDAEKSQRRQAIADRQAALATRESLIDQMVNGLHLDERVDVALADAEEADARVTRVQIGRIHSDNRSARTCQNACDEDRAVQAKLDQLADECDGWRMTLQPPVGGKPERLILIQRQN